MAKDKTDKYKQEKKGLAETLANINKAHGAMTIGRLGDIPAVEVDVISTGSRSLDKQLGAGGFPKGRIIELWGLEASGKTLLTLSAAANCQRDGGTVAFIDAEHAFNRKFAANLGVDVDSLVFCQPDYGEQALDIVEQLLVNNVVDLIIVDSVAGLVPKAERDGDMGDHHVGLQARMMGQACRKLTGPAAKSNTAVIFINQIREKVGVMFGDPRTTAGGNALKYYASVRLEVKRIGAIKEGDTTVGHRCGVLVKKNKVGQPHGEAEFDLYYGGAHPGIDFVGEVLDEAVVAGVVEKSGAWFSYKGERIGQGNANSKEFLRTNPKVMEDIMKELGT